MDSGHVSEVVWWGVEGCDARMRGRKDVLGMTAVCDCCVSGMRNLEVGDNHLSSWSTEKEQARFEMPERHASRTAGFLRLSLQRG